MKTRDGAMKSRVEKRSVVIAGHRTSVCLEDAFWTAVKEIAAGRDMTVSELVAVIDAGRRHGNLSSAVRLFVLDFYRNQLSARKPGCAHRANAMAQLMAKGNDLKFQQGAAAKTEGED